MRSNGLKLCVLLTLVHCTGTDTGNPVAPMGVALVRSPFARDRAPQVAPRVLEQLGRDNRDFAFALYREVAQDGDANLFFSPYGLQEALAMLYAGARGATEDEMKTALRLTLPQEQLHATFNAVDSALEGRADELSPPTSGEQGPHRPGDGMLLRSTNATFVPRGAPYEADYLDVLARNYGAGLFSLDFANRPEAARQHINDWFSEQTEGRIPALLPPEALTANTRLVLANAIYFKANWRDRFKPRNSSPGTFHAPAGDVPVTMMHGSMGLYAEGDGYQALQLEYASAAVSMIFVLPSAGRFEDVEARFDRSFVDGVISALARPADLDVTIPRFAYRARLDARAALSAMGMPSSFTAAADYSGIGPDLHLDGVLHQASIAIDEEGTNAAAGSTVTSSSSDPIPIYFRLDRPCLYLVYDQPTGQVLFLGRLMDPTR